MLRRCLLSLQQRTLHAVLNRFKVAGAHPDILAAVDPSKASHNGQKLIELERLLHARTTAEVRDQRETHRLTFWIKSSPVKSELRRDAGTKVARLGSEAELPEVDSSVRSVVCDLTPFATDAVVKQQLRDLFRSAGVDDDFLLPAAITSPDIASVLDNVREKHEEHLEATFPLAVRGERSVRFLRSIGVVLTLDDRGVTYLLTMPERFDRPHSSALVESPPPDDAAKAFLQERNMMAFDFRMGGSYSSVEHLVLAIERLEQIYRRFKGTCLRPGVCICITLTGAHCSILDDGTIVVPAAAAHTWEEFLLTLPQAKWDELVRLNHAWRADNPTKLKDQRAKVARLADALHYHSVVLDNTDALLGKSWQTTFLDTMLREETAIRKTVEKYRSQLRLDVLKNRGTIVVKPTAARQQAVHNVKTCEGRSDSSVACRATSDGKIHVNASIATSFLLLKFLREHNQTQAKRVLAFDTAMAALEGLSRSCFVDMAIDPEWRDREADVTKCINHFVSTAKPMAPMIATKSRSNLQQQRRGLLLIVSDRFHLTPSGKALVPWDIDAGSLQTALIGR